MKLELATFGAGCFWHVEETFRQLTGVTKTEVGYMGGTTKKPTYEDVCTDQTGHAEVVQVTFDPTKITYVELLEIFWNNHNPTTKNRQGPDTGTQYRSVIFYHNKEQKAAAEKSKKSTAPKWPKPVVTEILSASDFWRAEEYHQQYLKKRGRSVC